MLSRTADHLYWMSRYIERAESLARLVDAHYRMSLLPHSGETLAQSLSSTHGGAAIWRTPTASGTTRSNPRAVFEFVSLDRDYGGSIFSCLRAARENARAVRGSLTSELWETLNSTWLEAAVGGRARRCTHADIGQFVEWVKERSHLTRGVIIGTMMRDEAFHFTRIGTFLERADSTARILTAHQSDLIPGADAGVVPDPYEWSVLLRALSAFEVYRRVYRDVITPLKVRAAPDHARRHAALAAALLQGGLPELEVGGATSSPPKPSGAPAKCMPCCISAAWRTSPPAACRVSRAVSGARARSRRSHRIGLLAAPRGGVSACSMHIRHETRYRYERPVKYSVQSLHLTPRRDLSQRALTWTITAPGRRLEQVDALRQHHAPAHHRGAAP